MIISHKTSGVRFVCLLHLIFYYLLLNPSNTSIHINIIIILHVSTMQSIDTPSLLILTIKHNITMYWLPIELSVILSIMCTMFSVCILMSWQNFNTAQKCMSASKVKDDLRCSFDKQITSITYFSFNKTLNMPACVGPYWPSDFFDSNYKKVSCIIFHSEAQLLIINFLFILRNAFQQVEFDWTSRETRHELVSNHLNTIVNSQVKQNFLYW